jgi:hypothetical protein
MTNTTMIAPSATDSMVEQVAVQLFERRYEVEGTFLKYSWTDAMAENAKLGWSVAQAGPAGHGPVYSAHVMLDHEALRAAFQRSERMLHGES